MSGLSFNKVEALKDVSVLLYTSDKMADFIPDNYNPARTKVGKMPVYVLIGADGVVKGDKLMVGDPLKPYYSTPTKACLLAPDQLGALFYAGRMQIMTGVKFQ